MEMRIEQGRLHAPKPINMTDLLPFLTRLISLRDPHADGHSHHVRDLAYTLGQQIDLSSEQLRVLEFTARIHDIGKIAINEFVINKPGRFTEAEYIMVQQHSMLGSRLVENLELDPLIPAIILNHHENFDGTGYPRGVKGEDIPLEARIIRITDTYDALTSNRGYRPAFTHKASFQIMEDDSRFFDPELLEFFFKMKRYKH
jgi:HD-GYP domain-containing protein (c-di-GMP phosphodiesterase class II)